MKSNLQQEYSDNEFAIIDEIPIMSNTLLQIQIWFCKLFGSCDDITFAAKSVLAVGDLLQLPPIRSASVYIKNNSAFGSLFDFWQLFLLCELTEVMRQPGDKKFIDPLNTVKLKLLLEKHISLLNSRNSTLDVAGNALLFLQKINQKKNIIRRKLTKLIIVPYL